MKKKLAIGQHGIALVSIALLFAPFTAYVLGNRKVPQSNRELNRFGITSDGWSIAKVTKEALDDRLPMRQNAINWDSWIDQSIFGEQPAFGGAATPRVLEGKDGFLFLADAFEAACNPHGTTKQVATNLKTFANIIQRSGRQIVITVAPDKSSVLPDHLPEEFSLKDCHRKHQDQLWLDIGNAEIPGYLDLRKILRSESISSREPLYLRQDSHWDTRGSLAAIRRVVEQFKPGVWRDDEISFDGLARYTGDLEAMRGGSKEDQAPSFRVNRSRVKTVKSEYDDTYPIGYRRFSETIGPKSELIEGSTLLFFDSFGMAAIEQITPYFEKLETMHLSSFDTKKWIERIQASENIWFLSVERSLEYRLTYDMGNKEFLDALDMSLNK